MSTIAFQDNIPGGSSGSPKTGYLAGIITSGSTDVQLSLSNIGEEATNFYFRKPGTTDYSLIIILPDVSEEFWLSLTSTRTIEYYFDASIIQLSVVDFKTYGSSAAPVTAFTDAVSGGSAVSPKTGDVSVVSAGTTIGTFRFTNTGEFPMNLYVRQIGTTNFDLLQILPQTSTERRIALTAARTIEYYFDAGALKAEIVDSQITTTIPLTDVTSWLTMHGYTISASGDFTTAEVQLCLDQITAEVTMAATRYALIALQTLNASFKNHIILKGTVAQALYALRGKSGAQGLRAEAIQVNSPTADMYMGEYKSYIERLMSGIFYGA